PRLLSRSLLSLAAVAIVTLAAYGMISANATTAGFAYLLVVLVVASYWGFVEALFASLAATLALNYFFFEPVGTFTIEDPKNWVALFSFLATALMASRLSAQAKMRAQDAIEGQQDLERLYAFSRGILLIDNSAPFSKQLLQRLGEIFELTAALLYDPGSGEIHRAGPADVDGLEDQLRAAVSQGASFSDIEQNRFITAVR